jgi:hypothetical protein
MLGQDGEPESEPISFLGKSSDQAEKTDFFQTFVSGSETQKSTNADGSTTVTFTPGEKSVFRGGRSFSMTLDSSGQIRSASIMINRKFIDDSKYAGMSADFAKSFVESAAPDAAPKDAAEVRRSDSVWLGHETDTKMDGSGYSVTVQNQDTADGKVLTMRVSKNDAGGPAPAGNAVNDHTQPTAATSATEPVAADTDPERFAPLFLSESDLPGVMKCTQRLKAEDNPDKAFVAAGGQFAAMCVWTAENQSQKISRAIDIRWVLPDDRAAQNYLRGSLGEQSEGMPEIREAFEIGDESHVFGPGSQMTRALGTPPMYCCIFRQGRVIAKIFVALEKPAGDAVDPGVIAPMAKSAAAKIRAFEQTAATVAAAPSANSSKPREGRHLGVKVRASAPSAPGLKGVLVDDVVPGSPAAAAQLQHGDVIQKFDHHDVATLPDLQRLVSQVPSDKNVELQILRHGKPMRVSIELKDL